jgi:hypothetical protein
MSPNGKGSEIVPARTLYGLTLARQLKIVRPVRATVPSPSSSLPPCTEILSQASRQTNDTFFIIGMKRQKI